VGDGEYRENSMGFESFDIRNDWDYVSEERIFIGIVLVVGIM
jgi:hypothetical protein